MSNKTTNIFDFLGPCRPYGPDPKEVFYPVFTQYLVDKT